VFAAIAAGAVTRDDLAQRFGVLSSSKWLTDALNELGAVVDEHGRLSAPGQQLALNTGPHALLCFDSTEFGHDVECECWCHDETEEHR
jgi:hypothetical protein